MTEILTDGGIIDRNRLHRMHEMQRKNKEKLTERKRKPYLAVECHGINQCRGFLVKQILSFITRNFFV